MKNEIIEALKDLFTNYNPEDDSIDDYIDELCNAISETGLIFYLRLDKSEGGELIIASFSMMIERKDEKAIYLSIDFDHSVNFDYLSIEELADKLIELNNQAQLVRDLLTNK